MLRLATGELALEAHPLSSEGGLDIRVVELIELAALDFDDLPPDDFGLRLAGPVQERAVDESVALVRVDIGRPAAASAFSLRCESASSASRSDPSPCVCSVGWSRRVRDFVSAIATGFGPFFAVARSPFDEADSSLAGWVQPAQSPIGD